MKALNEIGWRKALRYAALSPVNVLLQLVPYPQIRGFLLKLLGAKIGKNSIIENAVFVNFYYNGFGNLHVGKNCFIGQRSLIDLAENVELRDNCTVSMGAIILTHTNVGYRGHPLQKKYPKKLASVLLGQGSFVGAGAIVFPGVEVGKRCMIGAGAVVNKSIGESYVVAGSPAKKIGTVK